MRALRLCLFTVLALPLHVSAKTPDDRLVHLMQELTDAPAPSGNEGAVRTILMREFRALGAKVSTDGLGNVIAIVPGTSDAPRVMVDAHMDEVGLVIRSITPDGFVKFLPMSINWFDQPLVDQRWQIMTAEGPVMAISGFVDKHAHTLEDNTRVFPSAELFLDVGAHNKAEAEAMGIAPGNFVAPWSPFTPLGASRYAAKAWDDRVGCLVMLEALRRMQERGIKPPNTIYFVGTVQEELGMRGAPAAVEAVKPDVGIAIETGVATDHPLGRKEFSEEKLGAGPTLYAYDNSMIPNSKLGELFRKLAAQSKIPLQTGIVAQYGQDASYIQKYSTGRPAINFAVPTRYTHLHTGVIEWSDVDEAIDLLITVLIHLDRNTVADLTRFEN